uniref:G_PROTEIN_RECEP_F1_2 domain-containing protein n=2 Tax=Loa loa TaxID=7209 RepID=A0A1I7V8I7_LOALO
MAGGVVFGDGQIAFLCITTVSLFGLLSNGFSLYIIRTRSLFRNAFGALCSSYLICNLEAIVLLLIWCTIVLSVKPPTLSSSTIFSIRLIGVLVNGAWFGSLFVHFFVALNRLCAIVYPIRYRELWSESKAFAAGIFSWTVGTSLCMVQLY